MNEDKVVSSNREKKELPFKIIEEMTTEDILSFVFPKGQTHPRTACRLWVLAENIGQFARVYSKECGNSFSVQMLSGNFRRKFLKPDFNLKVILDLTEQEFYKQVYYTTKLIVMDEKDLLELRMYSHPEVKKALSYSREVVENLFKERRQKKNESMNHYIQRVILEDRLKRIMECKHTIPNMNNYKINKFLR